MAIEAREHGSAQRLALVRDVAVGEVTAHPQRRQAGFDRRNIGGDGIDLGDRLDRRGNVARISAVGALQHPGELAEDRDGHCDGRRLQPDARSSAS